MYSKINYFFCGDKNKNLSHPGITRRFPRYAKRQNIDFYFYEEGNETDGTIVINQGADLTFWRRFKNPKFKLVFDANDSYLLDDSKSLKRIFRGLFKYLTGKHKYLEFNYYNTYLKLCEKVDVVVVGHYLLHEKLKDRFKNVTLIPDYSIERDSLPKTDFNLSKDGTINVFWEGLGSSYMPFRDISRIFSPIKDKYNFIFHFVSDLSFFALGDVLNKKIIFEVAKKEAPDFCDCFRFYQWSEFALNRIAIACDFAIIPLPMDFSGNYYKPENKLIHLWRMSVPTIVSAIPSYRKVMNQINLNDFCFNDGEWRLKIAEFIENENIRIQNGNSGNAFVSSSYSNERIDELWSGILSETNVEG
jgi:hypothetical protein